MATIDDPLESLRLHQTNEWLREQIARLRLTDEEREAIEDAAHLCESSPYPLTQKDGATLRNLLRRVTL